MPHRSYASTANYRFGFNGKENDNESKGLGNQQDYGMRIYDPRLGRFLSIDPLSYKYQSLTPYQFASNRAIDGIDLDGLEYFDSKKFGGQSSLYLLFQFKKPTDKHIWDDIFIRNQGIHNIVFDDTRINKLEDPDVPEVNMVNKRSSSNRAQAREKFETRAANLKAVPDIASGVVDLIEFGMKKYHDNKFKNEIDYAITSIISLDKSEKLVNKATEARSFPRILKTNNSFLTDLANYITDHTVPNPLGRGVAYVDLVKSWGDLLFNNQNDVLNGKFNFSGIELKPVKIITNQSDNQSKTFWEPAGIISPELLKALSILKRFSNGIKPSETTVTQKE